MTLPAARTLGASPTANAGPKLNPPSPRPDRYLDRVDFARRAAGMARVFQCYREVDAVVAIEVGGREREQPARRAAGEERAADRRGGRAEAAGAVVEQHDEGVLGLARPPAEQRELRRAVAGELGWEDLRRFLAGDDALHGLELRHVTDHAAEAAHPDLLHARVADVERHDVGACVAVHIHGEHLLGMLAHLELGRLPEPRRGRAVVQQHEYSAAPAVGDGEIAAIATVEIGNGHRIGARAHRDERGFPKGAVAAAEEDGDAPGAGVRRGQIGEAVAVEIAERDPPQRLAEALRHARPEPCRRVIRGQVHQHLPAGGCEHHQVEPTVAVEVAGGDDVGGSDPIPRPGREGTRSPRRPTPPSATTPRPRSWL